MDGALQTFAAYNIPVIPGYNSITAEIIDKNGLSNTTAINVEVDGPAAFSFEYDQKGNLTHRNWGTESIVYEYDQKNRLSKATDSESPAEPVVYRMTRWAAVLKSSRAPTAPVIFMTKTARSFMKQHWEHLLYGRRTLTLFTADGEARQGHGTAVLTGRAE